MRNAGGASGGGVIGGGERKTSKACGESGVAI